jgi:phage-related minor tail protein
MPSLIDERPFMSDSETPKSLEQRTLDAQERQLETLTRLSERFGQSLSQAFAKNSREGKELDNVLQSIGKNLLTTTARSASTQLQKGVSSGIGLFLNNMSGQIGGLFGGTSPFSGITPFATGGVVSKPTYFPMQGGLGLMGESGAEAIMPLARGPDGRLGVAGGGGAKSAVINVTINTPDAQSFRKSEAQISATLAKAVARGQRAL